MLSADENQLLTRTDPETPMGRYFRKFWQPVALSEELPETDGPPIRITMLGEKLVAFRDSLGRVGLFSEKCPHRGANMFYGRNEECGLRCVYHGWKFNTEGKAVELPNVPAGTRHHDTVRIKAYPTREYGDIVWAYMDASRITSDEKSKKNYLPNIPELEFGRVPSTHRYVSKQLMECNWAQIMEGDLDTSHFSFLHMPAPTVPSNENPEAPADERRLRWIRDDPLPEFSILEHEVGFVVGGVRKADDNSAYWRITQFMLPAHGTGPSTLPGETYFGFTLVPVTNTLTWCYVYAWNPERPIQANEREKYRRGYGIIAKVDSEYRPFSNLENDFLIDRNDQKHVSFTGIKGFAEQDAMIQQCQGSIADRTQETLTVTDAAVVRFRRVLIREAKALCENNQEPKAPLFHKAYCTRPGSWITRPGRSLENVLLERFGDNRGLIKY